MMDNIDIIPFKKEHAHHIISNPMNDPAIQIAPQFKKYALFLEIPGMSFTAVKDGKIEALKAAQFVRFLASDQRMSLGHNGF